jgi:hypothetical protein
MSGEVKPFKFQDYGFHTAVYPRQVKHLSPYKIWWS